MRKPMMIPVLLLILAGCGGNDAAPADAASPASTTPSTTLVSVSVETGNTLIGHNFNDSQCVFAEPEYEIRDGAGTILDVGRIEDSAASIDDADWAAVGNIQTVDPYLCILRESFRVEPADIYTITVTTFEAPILSTDPKGVEVSGETTFRQEEATTVTVEIEGSR